MSFGNFGFSEILIIAVIVLIFFGPRRMPEIGRAVGGAMREFRRGLNEIQRELQEAEKAAKVEPDQTGAKASGPGATKQQPKPGETPTPLAAALASTSAWSATETSPDSEVGERPAADEEARPADHGGAHPPASELGEAGVEADGSAEEPTEEHVVAGEPESSPESAVTDEPETPGRA